MLKKLGDSSLAIAPWRLRGEASDPKRMMNLLDRPGQGPGTASQVVAPDF
jgi:hypothetical protein